MSTLTVNPVPEVFSKVPELTESLHTFQEKRLADELIPRLGEIFVKHNVFDHFGLSMVHRHFEMTSEEILVESMRRDKSMSVFVPWNLSKGSCATPSDESIWTTYELKDSEQKFIVPQNWCFLQGQLIPFEFLATDDPALPQPTAGFAEDLHKVLKEFGVERYVGIRRLLNLKERSSWETTPEGVRANVIVFGEKPEHIKREEMVQVFWAFDEWGNVRQGTAWCGICTHNCGTCTHYH